MIRIESPSLTNYSVSNSLNDEKNKAEFDRDVSFSIIFLK